MANCVAAVADHGGFADATAGAETAQMDGDIFPPEGGPPDTPEGTVPPEWKCVSRRMPGGARGRGTSISGRIGGSRRRVDSQDFKGGEAFAMFGGVEVDMRSATIVQNEVVIDASALFLAASICRCRENWNVSVEGHGILEVTRQVHAAMPESARPRVVITGSAFWRRGGKELREESRSFDLLPAGSGWRGIWRRRAWVRGCWRCCCERRAGCRGRSRLDWGYVAYC